MFDTLPTSHDVEASAAVLRGEAATLARWREDSPPGEESSGAWEHPQGGPPAPGAAESARGYIRVAETLEALREPLKAFESHQEGGGTPYEFLMLMMSDAASSGIIESEATNQTPGG